MARQYTMSDIRHAYGRMQLDVTALGYADPPEWDALQQKMNTAAKKHFNSKPFDEIAEKPAPQSVTSIFKKMCEVAEKLVPNYLAPISFE